MCLLLGIIRNRREARNFCPQKADREIAVFKLFNTIENDPNKLESPRMGFIYKRGRKYRLFFGMTKQIKELPWSGKFSLAISHGFHAFTDEATAKLNQHIIMGDVVIKCVIPKGAKYFSDGWCVASNSIIIP
jgi:hypothetical protein